MSHTHNVVDSDPMYVIDPASRAIQLEEGSADKTIMQGDHNSERLTFKLPKVVEGHDMTQCTRVEVHFTNYNTENGTEVGTMVTAADLGEAAGDSEMLACSAKIPGDATGISGNLAFSLSFVCSTEDGIEYIWNTDEYDGLVVKPRRSHTKTAAQLVSDVLGQYIQEITDQVKAGVLGEITGLPPVDPDLPEDGSVLAAVFGEWTQYDNANLSCEYLETEDKTIVGAINELKTKIDELNEALST